MKRILLSVIIIILISCNSNYKNPHVKIYTSMGDIEVELYPEKAPKTVTAFLQYVDSGFYKNSSFYRVLLEEGMDPSTTTGLIQGGVYRTNMPAHPVAGIVHESTKQTGLTHSSGTISLARTTVGSATTEFFICIGDEGQFDEGGGTPEDGKGYAAFGKVVDGMKTARKIQSQPSNGEAFNPKIEIYKIVRL